MLQFEIESLEGLDDNQKALYVEHDGKFRLQVEGIDPADELKNALKKERENSKSSAQRLAELESQLREAEQSKLEESQQFEQLYRSEKEQRAKDKENYESLKKQIAEKERDTMAVEVVSKLTRDTAKAEALKRFALDHMVIMPDGTVEINGMTSIELSEKLKTDYPFLVDGNQASGGGAGGGTTKPANPVEVKKGNANEMMKSAFEAPK